MSLSNNELFAQFIKSKFDFYIAIRNGQYLEEGQWKTNATYTICGRVEQEYEKSRGAFFKNLGVSKELESIILNYISYNISRNMTFEDLRKGITSSPPVRPLITKPVVMIPTIMGFLLSAVAVFTALVLLGPTAPIAPLLIFVLIFVEIGFLTGFVGFLVGFLAEKSNYFKKLSNYENGAELWKKEQVDEKYKICHVEGLSHTESRQNHSNDLPLPHQGSHYSFFDAPKGDHHNPLQPIQPVRAELT